ncbi:hypothetical protein [Glycomyces sp. NPDC047010]|uniref:hypothetical protein n=1 Tax=Glycomyces sp. NPDC047010 TaxID=3155023 RepID=UPI0033E543BD
MNMGQSGMLFVFGMSLLVTAIIITGIAFAAAAAKSRAAEERAEGYRELAEKASVDATEVRAALIEVKGRLAAVERLLKDRDRAERELFLRIAVSARVMGHALTHGHREDRSFQRAALR